VLPPFLKTHSNTDGQLLWVRRRIQTSLYRLCRDSALKMTLPDQAYTYPRVPRSLCVCVCVCCVVCVCVCRFSLCMSLVRALACVRAHTHAAPTRARTHAAPTRTNIHTRFVSNARCWQGQHLRGTAGHTTHFSHTHYTHTNIHI
jgi:hypothetical protein